MEVTSKDLKIIVHGLVEEYKKVKKLYDKCDGESDTKLKESALQGMANALQLQGVAIQNFANWKHIMRQDKEE